MPLYKDASFDFQHIAFCGLASVADVLMVLLFYIGLALLLQDLFWVQDFKWQGFLVMIVGGAGAILMERRHMASGNWAYAGAMPTIPVADVGLSPVLQFTILPVIVYYISSYITKNERKNS